MKNILTRILAVVTGAALFVGAFVVSMMFFAVIVVVGVVVAGYFLWKTRHVRKQMRQRHDGRDVIEGTVISSRDLSAVEIAERPLSGK